MRVLIVHDFGIAPGGAENMSLALRKELDVRGHEARIFASRARPADAQPVVVVRDQVQVFAQRPDFLVQPRGARRWTAGASGKASSRPAAGAGRRSARVERRRAVGMQAHVVGRQLGGPGLSHDLGDAPQRVRGRNSRRC
jgi:hypothetical protein